MWNTPVDDVRRGRRYAGSAVLMAALLAPAVGAGQAGAAAAPTASRTGGNATGRPAADASTTLRVSVSSTGAQANALSEQPSVSADGRYIVFASRATNLVPGSSNGTLGIYLHDLRTGRTSRVDLGVGGAPADGDAGINSWISANGRYVVFTSDATNLVRGGAKSQGVYVRDLRKKRTSRVDVGAGGAPADSDSVSPGISANGRYVAFVSRARNLVAGADKGQWNVFVRDRVKRTTVQASIGVGGAEPDGISLGPTISPNGRYVTFLSQASDLVPGDTNGVGDTFVRDLRTNTTTRIDVGTGGAQGDDLGVGGTMLSSGKVAVFGSHATNFAAGTDNHDSHVYIRDLAGDTTRIADASQDGAVSNGGSFWAQLTPDGRSMTFDSLGSNLVAGDTNGAYDSYQRDLTTNQVTRMSVGADGSQGDAPSFYPAASADGKVVVFLSFASNLVPGDTNGVPDVFVRIVR